MANFTAQMVTMLKGLGIRAHASQENNPTNLAGHCPAAGCLLPGRKRGNPSVSRLSIRTTETAVQNHIEEKIPRVGQRQVFVSRLLEVGAGLSRDWGKAAPGREGSKRTAQQSAERRCEGRRDRRFPTPTTRTTR